MSNIKEKIFFNTLIENSREDLYNNKDDHEPFLLNTHIAKSNLSVEYPFTISELASMRDNLVDVVKNITNNTGNNICYSIITIVEYFVNPERFM